jgi:hypothetical protein
VVAVGLVGYDIRRKGLVRGVVNSGLDAIPFVGAGKNLIEYFTGDFLSDKEQVKMSANGGPKGRGTSGGKKRD